MPSKSKTRRKETRKVPPPDAHGLRTAADPRLQKKHGLYNQGATCYLNSVLQVLFMTPEFREALESRSAPKSMDQDLFSLFKALERATASTKNITKTLEIKVNQQRDAAEYFERILARTSAKASKIFKGELTAKCKCLKCENESRNNQPFWSLPLPLVESDTDDCKVENGIKEYFKESSITGEDQLYCDNCKDKTKSTVKLDMTHHPEVLTLLLKRFHFDYNHRMYIKNQQKVAVPFRLRVENRKYELYAIVNHFGSLKGGHYTADIKSQDDEKWHHFDDTDVTLMDYQPFQLDCSERSERAYLLFYKANKNDDNPTQNVEGSPAGDAPKTSRNTVEKDKDGHESDDKERNKKKRHCSGQLENDKQGITLVKDEEIVENLDKPRDDGTSVTDVEMENINQKTVDQKEAEKNEKPSDGNSQAKITQTSSTGSQRGRKRNNKAQGNQQREKDEEPGTRVGDKGLKGSPTGDSPKTSENTVEKDNDSEDRHESDDKERNQKKRHRSGQLDKDKQGIILVKDEEIVENFDKPRDDGACATDVEMENTNQKTVVDQKEPGTNVGEKGLKVQTAEEFHSRDEKNDQKLGQCLNPDDQEKRDYQHNREEEHPSKANGSEFSLFSGGHGLSKSPPEKRKKNSFRDEGDEEPALTRTKPEGPLNEKVEDPCKVHGELQGVPNEEVKEMVEERQTKAHENIEMSIVEQVLSRSKAGYTNMAKPTKVFSKAASDKTDLHTPINNEKENPTQQESLREEIHYPTVATEPIQIKGREESVKTGQTKERTAVQEALLRSKQRGTKRTETVEQIESSVSDETDFSISSQMASVPFRKAETHQILDPEETRHPHASRGLSKSYNRDPSPPKSSTESTNPSTTETQQFGVTETSEVEGVVGKRPIGEDGKAGENGESSFAQQLYESKGLAKKQMKPAEDGKPQPKVEFTQSHDGQRSRDDPKDLPTTGLPEQTVSNRPEVNGSTEADIKSGPGSKVEKQTGGEKQRKGRNKIKKDTFSISGGFFSPRR